MSVGLDGARTLKPRKMITNAAVIRHANTIGDVRVLFGAGILGSAELFRKCMIIEAAGSVDAGAG
jgi:hypothetical protein